VRSATSRETGTRTPLSTLRCGRRWSLRARAAGSLGAGGVNEDADSADGGQAGKKGARPESARVLLHELSTQLAVVQGYGLRQESFCGPVWGPHPRHPE
jgi:hypothetical protein